MAPNAHHTKLTHGGRARLEPTGVAWVVIGASWSPPVRLLHVVTHHKVAYSLHCQSFNELPIQAQAYIVYSIPHQVS